MNHVLTHKRRGFLFAVALATVATMALGVLAPAAMADDRIDPEPTWSYSVTTLDTGVANGYQLAMDADRRKVYFSDAKWRTESRNATTGQITASPGTGKLVEFDVATKSISATHDFTGLSRNDGTGPESSPYDWTGVTGNSLTSMRTTFSPYGVAVDSKTVNPTTGAVDPTIVTTTARGQVPGVGYGGNIVVYSASQGAPTDADRLWLFDDGTPIFDGPRRIAVNSVTHKAYVTNLGTSRGGDPATRPGFIAVIDLQTRKVEARVKVPNNKGGLGVAVDEGNNLIYVGSYLGDKLSVIDGSAVNTSNPKNIELNNAAVTELSAVVGANARPTYNAELKRVYVSAYDANYITVVDADPASPVYGTVLDRIHTGPTNFVEVDGERGLLYSANLGAQEVVVFDTENHDVLLRVPTSGNALNIAIDPVTRDAWVSNFAGTGKTDIITVTKTDPEPDWIEGTTWDGAKFYYPAEGWVEGKPLQLRGEGWTRSDGGKTRIAIVINGGDVEPNVPATVPPPVYVPPPADVWAVIDTNPDGTWSTSIPYPTSQNSNADWSVGESHRLNLLTGSLRPGDVARSGLVQFGVVAGPTVDPGTSGDISVTFDVDTTTIGGLSLLLTGNAVSLGTATINNDADRLVASGALPEVRVTDTREQNVGWSVAGASSHFVNGDGDVIAGATLGWTPRLVSSADNQIVNLGPVVSPGVGFVGGSTLASTLADEGRGTAGLGADLLLEVPTSSVSGSYSGRITITLS